MDPLGELLASDHRRTLEFFVMNLKDVSEPTVDQQELLYNASVLAHYAQISIDADSPMAAPADLTAVFDHFVADMNVLTDPLVMETAGAQCLLLAGFFEDQMRRRHNIRWYAELGASFFSRAALHERSASTARPRIARPALSDDPASFPSRVKRDRKVHSPFEVAVHSGARVQLCTHCAS